MSPIIAKISALLISVSVCVTSFPMFATAQTKNMDVLPDLEKTTGTENVVLNYRQYNVQSMSVPRAIDAISLDMTNATIIGGELVTEYEGVTQVAVFDTEGSIGWKLQLPATAKYTILVEYASTMKNNHQYELSVLRNGHSLFAEAEELVLRKRWYQGTAEKTYPDRIFKVDSYGNELADVQSEQQCWQQNALYDSQGLYNDALEFVLADGDTLTVAFSVGDIAIKRVILSPMEELTSYEQVKQSYKEAGYTAAAGEPIFLQAEMPQYVSDSIINPTSDHLSAASQPQDAYKQLLNTIGKTYWQYTGQCITYKFQVKESALYKLNLRVRQNFQRGVQIGRRILLDNTVPFKELNNYHFQFSNNWYIEELGDEDGAYLFYLEAGQIHTLTIEVVTAYPEIIQQLQQVQLELNDFYRQILMIVGTQPDPYRDYMLTDTIPGFRTQLQGYHETLESLLKVLHTSGFEKGGESVTVEELSDQIVSFIEDPDKVPTRLSTMKDNLSSLGTWMLALTQQPLEMDYIVIASANAKKVIANKGFLKNSIYTFKVFLASFTMDYTMLEGEVSGKSNLEVWANVGRDQAQILKQMVDNQFEEQYQINVNLNLVQQALIPATLSGKGPDIAVMVNPTDVINLAVRDALVSLNDFTGDADTASFTQVKKWFHEFSCDLYSYEDLTYGLPIDEQFFMMFYRSDVLGELGLSVPKTWDQLNDVISVLAHNYLSVGIPSGANETMFQTLLLQNGGTYYIDGWKSTGLNSDSAVGAFRRWTEFFTKYSLPVEYDPYSRFRSGEMPIVINSYVFYNQLYSSAPEIKGLWEMANIPGTVRSDGTVNQTSVGTGTAVVMFKKANNYDAGWKFMQWLVGAEAQTNYAKIAESVLGVAGRFNTANVEAFQNISWKKSTEEQIMAQWDKMQVVSMTPVSYFFTRNITNAFRKAVYSSVNPREALGTYTRDIEKEIRRKRAMFGLDE
ncbi:MAG: extracellular solute-binding protein [Oscillospiraceae bacterium]|nr:extracellular solute-binding protein [Oscillospiraceae bacterium]